MHFDSQTNHIMAINPEAPQAITLATQLTLEPYQTRNVRTFVHGNIPDLNCVIASVTRPGMPYLTGGPAICQVDRQGFCTMAITNASPHTVTLERNVLIGTVEVLEEGQPLIPLNGDNMINVVTDSSRRKVLSNEEIRQRAHLQDIPQEYRERYLALLQRHRQVISMNKNDLGRSRKHHHRIYLKDLDPAFVQQFPLKPDHQQFIEDTLESWLKLGVVRRTKSLYNSPIFCVPKKGGQGLRIVQDFRALNSKTQVDKYSMKDISECIGDIGRAGSTIFTTIDLTSGFWQMPIHPDDSHLTAFTIRGKGQFEWITSPMGLL